MSGATADAFVARPDSLSVWLTAAAGVVAVAASATALVAVALGLAGLVALVVSVARGTGRLQTLGTVALFAGVLVAGVAGASPPAMLVATGATVVAWDASENALGLGRQVGSRAGTRRAVLAHTGATATVATLVGALALLVYRTARTGQSTTVVVLLLLASVVFALVLNR